MEHIAFWDTLQYIQKICKQCTVHVSKQDKTQEKCVCICQQGPVHNVCVCLRKQHVTPQDYITHQAAEHQVVRSVNTLG